MSDAPLLSAVDTDAVGWVDGTRIRVGEAHLGWTLMVVLAPGADGLAVLEDFSAVHGSIAVVGPGRPASVLAKSAEPTWADPTALHLGHSLTEVITSERDLLGDELLGRPGDPVYETVAACFPPLVNDPTHTFVGTTRNSDKIPVGYGGANALVEPAAIIASIAATRSAGRVLDGLVGGWLPVLRYVYPEVSGSWSELIMFAPERIDLDNDRLQPVWFRLARVEGGQLVSVRHLDSYLPYPPHHLDAPPESFYAELIALRASLDNELETATVIEIPDQRLADQARHSLVRAMITRIGDHPKYGVVDRNYGGAEHDGFQDTFTVDVTAALDWGLVDLARRHLDDYLTHFVRDDGSLHYRGPQTGQYGRMLTVIAQYARVSGDHDLLLTHRDRIEAITELLLSLWQASRDRPADDPAYGIIAGWCEADSCLDPDPDRYRQPYLSNTAEAARGIGDLAPVWRRIGVERDDPYLMQRGDQLAAAAVDLRDDLVRSIRRSVHLDLDPAWLPVIAGAGTPFPAAVGADPQHPLFRSYRANTELLFCGLLDADDARLIIEYRAAHHDTVLGMPIAYNLGHGVAPVDRDAETAGFLSYGHAYGLIQHDHVREYLLMLYALSAHQYSRGSWTAPETRRLAGDQQSAGYCVPAQLVVPLMLRWLLAWEDPTTETLWLMRAAPRDWLIDDAVVTAAGVATRWGRVSFRAVSALASGRIDVVLELGTTGPALIIVRLRLPAGHVLATATLDGQECDDLDPAAETVMLHRPAGRSHLIVRTRPTT